MEKRIIWQDAIYADKQDYIEAFAQGLKDDYVSEHTTLREFIDGEIEVNYDSEMANLNKPVDGLIVASIRLWKGRKEAHKKFDNLNECLSSHCGGYLRVYVDENGELEAQEVHHDGTNVYAYREWNEGVTDEQKEDALGDYDKMVALTHKLGDKVAKIYCW